MQMCVMSEQTAIIWTQKSGKFWFWLANIRQTRPSMFAFFVSANVAKLFFKLFTLLKNLFLWCGLK